MRGNKTKMTTVVIPWAVLVLALASLPGLHVEGRETSLRRKRRVLDVIPVAVPDKHSKATPNSGDNRNSAVSRKALNLFWPGPRNYESSSRDEAQGIDSFYDLFGTGDRFSMSFSMPTPPSTPRPTSAPTPVSTTAKPPTTPPAPQPTRPATPAPTTFEEACLAQPSRERALVFVLFGGDPDFDLFDTSNPRGAAFNWILNEDSAQIEPCTYPGTEQRYALAVFYYSTLGDSWTNDAGWLSGSSECEWFGVTCNADSQLVVLELEGNNVSGILPWSLGYLTSMETFSMFNNSIGGTIPAFFGDLSALKVFDVEINELIGQAFVELRNAESLESYRVSSNQLSGTIIDTLPSSLKELWAATNTITGEIPSTIGALTNLESIFLYSNSLQGTIPTSVGNLNLLRLQLHENRLSSTIPQELYQNTRLLDLRLDGNQFTGTLSTAIGSLNALLDLRMNNNVLAGTIPAEIARLSSLRVLRMNSNSFTGTIRDAFDQFQELRFTDFSMNILSGTIPFSLFDIPIIEIVYLYENELTGPIPSNFANAPELRDLYIQDNRLTGTVPSPGTDQLQSFTEFRLELNEIGGTMPPAICALRGSNNDTDLVTLTADCGGNPPQIECDCCTACVDV